MATRFYPDPTFSPDVSPTVDGIWDEVASLIRRKLTIDSPLSAGSSVTSDTDTFASVTYFLLYQFVSEPLDSISATFAVSKAAFRCKESGAKLDAVTHIVFRKCDGDGNSPVTIASITDDTEYDDGDVVNRFVGAANLADQALSQGDRLIVEVGFYSSATKSTSLVGSIYVRDNSGTDLPENDTETAAYNSWIETGDTFTEASGEPAAIKLGPMFTFA